jgi:hypothetical protein
MLIWVRWQKKHPDKSRDKLCLAAKGRLQGWADKLMLCALAINHFF